MPQALLQWFAPPAPSHGELRRDARALWLVSWPFFAVVAVVLGIAVLVEPQTLARRATTVTAVGVLVTILHVINRRGRPLLASWMLVIGLTVLVTQRAWVTGGIHAPVAVFYALFIVMAAALLGTWGGVVTALVCVLGAIVLAVGEALGWLTPRPGAGSPLSALVFVILAIGLALVLQTLMTFRRREGMAVDAFQMFVHDMRSPLAVVLARLQLLREETYGENAGHVEGAIDGAEALYLITNNLLDLSRLEAGSMPMRAVRTDLAALASFVVGSLGILQSARFIDVEAVGETHCDCDPELMRRVLDNLVSNAIKHTSFEGRVRVLVEGLSDRVRVAVHDEGPGVPADRRARMFEPFNAEGLRAANGSASSGLGLAFCRLAVEAQRGTIRVENGHPTGSVFIVELPR